MEGKPKSDIETPTTATKASNSELDPSSSAEIGSSGAGAPHASRDGGRDVEKAALENDLKQAYQEFKNASNEEEKDQARKKLEGLMAAYKEQYQSTASTASTASIYEERLVPTKQLWNEADARQQETLAPRSAFTKQPKGSSLAQDDPHPSEANQAGKGDKGYTVVTAPAMLPTKQLWDENTARQQDPTAPRSAFTKQPKGSSFAQDDPHPSEADQAGKQDKVYSIMPEMLSTKQLRDEVNARQQDPTEPRSAFTKQPKDFPSAQNVPRQSATDQASKRDGPKSRGDLAQEAKSAEKRWRAAPLGSQARSRAFHEFEEAEDKLKKLDEESESDDDMGFCLFTDELWGEEDPRVQEPTQPRSAHPRKTKDNSDYNDSTNNNTKDSIAQDANAQTQSPKTPPTATQDATKGVRQQDSEMQPASQSGGSNANGGRSRSIGNIFLPSAGNDDAEEGDLEAGTKQKPGKKGRTDDYDVHGRKRVFAPRRDERIVDPVPKKCNYGPGAIPLPEPTYLDRQGRTELEVFQALVGIHFLANAGAPIDNKAKQLQPASVMSDIFLPSRAAAYRHRNRGLYDRCISQDMKMRVMYSFSHYMISFLYLLQILVAATLTGLSSYTNTAGVALTTLGAINTVLAGILAWLNGQGMPVRYRRSRDQFREVVRAIEDAERMFSTIDYVDWPAGTRPTPVGERDKLFKMYEKARQDQEANYPDTHENADKSEIANHTKELEAKIEKHKTQKKAKAAELQTALDKLQEKHAAKSNDSESTAAESNPESSHHSKNDLDKWAEQLEVRQRNADLALAGLAKERDQAHEDFETMKQIIKNMCSKENLEPEQVRSKLEARGESKK